MCVELCTPSETMAQRLMELIVILLYLLPPSKYTLIPFRIYQEIRKLEELCIAKHNCYTKQKTLLNCKCDSDCSIYGDCCKHSEFLNEMENRGRRMDCISGYYIKTKCPPIWENQEVRYQCETYKNISDHSSRVPAVSLRTKISYRNPYCAVCNDDQTDAKWKVQLACPRVSRDSDFQGFEYNKTSLSWMARLMTNLSEEISVPCIIRAIPKIADNSSVIPRKCHPAASECAADWSDDFVKEKCLSYQGIICTRRRCYRNAFCAVCNNEPLEHAECKDLFEQEEGDDFHLEDLNEDMDEGDSEDLDRSRSKIDLRSLFILKSQENNTCKQGQTWDPALRLCLTLI